MLKVVQPATASALNNQEATATFLLLPDWMENSTNAFTKPALTTRMFALFLETSKRQKCATCHSSTSSKAKHHPCQMQHGAAHLSSLNKAAREQLITNKPSWLEK